MECILGIFRKYRIVRNLSLNLDTLKINIEERDVEERQGAALTVPTPSFVDQVDKNIFCWSLSCNIQNLSKVL